MFLANADILQDQTYLAWVIAEHSGNPFRALNMTSMHWFMHVSLAFFKVRTMRFHWNSWHTQHDRIILWWRYTAAKRQVIAESLCAVESINYCAVLNMHRLPVESLRWWRAHIPLNTCMLLLVLSEVAVVSSTGVSGTLWGKHMQITFTTCIIMTKSIHQHNCDVVINVILLIYTFNLHKTNETTRA